MISTKKRRRRRSCLYVFALLPFLLFSAVCGEDAAQQDERNSYSGTSSYSNKSSNKNSSSKEKNGFQNASPFCYQKFIEVNGVYITCDSPGAYYYGGSAYRKSEVCKTGDKAKLSFECKLLRLAIGSLFGFSSSPFCHRFSLYSVLY